MVIASQRSLLGEHVVPAFAGTSVGCPVLTTMVVLPAIGAVVIGLLPAGRKDVLRLVALLFSVIAGVFTIWTLLQFDASDAGFQLVDRAEWIPEFGISWFLGIDGISLFLVVLTGILFPIAIVGRRPAPRPQGVLRLAAACSRPAASACSSPSTCSCSS